jgi:hypothetical protein
VELEIQRPDVEIRLSSLNGEIRALPPGFTRVRTEDGYRIKSGRGGPSVSIRSVNGDVVVKGSVTAPAEDRSSPWPRS